ncbi:CUB domain-containing protein [Drosophila kikkawai]|uniref:CUB domain-containing protein n=1 Tax=Drosophila kikkawai TaxID=30033 RepID=A0A6P4HSX3_DROKI
MAILNLQLISVIIFLVAALEAQESPATESETTTEATTTEDTTTEATTTEATTTEATGPPEPTTDSPEPTTDSPETTTICSSCPENSTTPTTDPLPKAINSLENGGYPFVKPGNHTTGVRQVRAHDGFHNLRSEKQWAHWNDAFTTTPKL